jgi:hypothetical protein
MDYQEHLNLQRSLSEDGRIIAAPRLFNFSGEEIYAAMMDMMSRPLADGTPSPFTSKAAGTAHSFIASAMTLSVTALGHEVDLMADRSWVNLLRLLGAELSGGSYPVIQLEFERSAEAVAAGIPAVIDVGTLVTDRFDGVSAYTNYTITIEGTAKTGVVEANLTTLSSFPNWQIGTMRIMPRSIPYVDGVVDIAMIDGGGDEETLAEAVTKIRSGVRTGNLGRYRDDALIDSGSQPFLGRCVTLRDHVLFAKRLGAAKANVVRGIQAGTAGYFGDLTTVIVYPEGVVNAIDRDLRKIAIAGTRLKVIPSEIIPVDGTIIVKALPEFSASQVRTKIATAIVDTVNPPYGNWGDVQFAATLSDAIERIYGIYAVPTMLLKHAGTNAPLSSIDIKPWHLFEIQNTLDIRIEL